MNIRKASLTDAKAVAKLSCLLWPDHLPEEMEEEFSALIENNDVAQKTPANNFVILNFIILSFKLECQCNTT